MLQGRQLVRSNLGDLKPGVRRCTVVARAAVRSTARQLLDSFWEARGVLDPVHRKRLVDTAEALGAEPVRPLDTAPLPDSEPLPGLPATWQLEESTPEVLAASRRLLALQQMLGGGLAGGSGRYGDDDGGPSGSGRSSSSSISSSTGRTAGIDVVWMVVREPRLLSSDLTQLTGRLLEMKVATYGMDVDVLKLVEAQPALLLSDRWQLDLDALQQAAPMPDTAGAGTGTTSAGTTQAPPASGDHLPLGASSGRQAVTDPGSGAQSGSGSGSGSGQSSSFLPGGGESGAAAGETLQQLVQAWQYGITSDGDREWAQRLTQLSEYVAAHGDACVGFRDGDDPELARWATKQRADMRRGELAPRRLSALTLLGFHFDADEAEWCRWFAELGAFKATTGHASPMPLVTGGDMYLINWCAVQRIARRCGVMSESRVQRLEELGFDWTGADPLS